AIPPRSWSPPPRHQSTRRRFASPSPSPAVMMTAFPHHNTEDRTMTPETRPAAPPSAEPPAAPPERPDPMTLFAREIATYRRELPRLLEDDEAGRFMLLHGDEILSIWDTCRDAIQAGHQRFGPDATICVM